MSNKILIAVGVVLIFIVGGLVAVKGYRRFRRMRPDNDVTTVMEQSPTAAAKVLFDQSEFAKMAYQIYPGALSADAKKAMTGFKMNTTMQPDGSAKIELTSTNPEYKNQTYTVKAGEKLMFIEKYLQDDNEKEDTDKGLRDDTAAVVGVDGFEVSQ